MNGLIGNTDFEWYQFLLRQDLEEVNFWRPMGTQGFAALRQGEPLIFKLKKGHGSYVVGFGLFTYFVRMKVERAWDLFGAANGATNKEAMWTQIGFYVQRMTHREIQPDHEIGCVLLATPVYFPESAWIKGPKDWKDQTVAGKKYSLEHGEGARIWNECQQRAEAMQLSVDTRFNLEALAIAARYGKETTIRPRLGQGIFRFAVAEAYGRACALTREHSLPVLEASHIVPYNKGGIHDVANGIFFRVDVHRLFDAGYVTVRPDLTFQVSDRLKEEYDNGKSYYELAGSKIWVPKSVSDRPSREYLERHNDTVFRK